ASGVVVAADAANAAGEEGGVARILAAHENAVAAEDRGRTVALGDLPVGEIDFGVNAQAADDARDGIPGHFDELTPLGANLAPRLDGGGHGCSSRNSFVVSRDAQRSAFCRRAPLRVAANRKKGY